MEFFDSNFLEILDDYATDFFNYDAFWAWSAKAFCAFVGFRFLAGLFFRFSRSLVRVVLNGLLSLCYYRQSGWLYLVSDKNEVKGPIRASQVIHNAWEGMTRVHLADGCLYEGTIYYRKLDGGPKDDSAGTLYQGKYIFARKKLSRGDIWYEIHQTPNPGGPIRIFPPSSNCCFRDDDPLLRTLDA